MLDNSTQIIAQEKFYGGMSADPVIGPEASCSYLRALDHRTKPSQLSVLPGPRKISAGVVNDLILKIVQVQNGSRYAYGDQGYVYKIDTENVVTYAGKLAEGTDGLLYRSDIDALYLATATEIHRFYPMSGTPSFDVAYGVSRSTDSNAYRTGGTSTYAVPTTINETELCYFSSDIEPFYSIKVNIQDKGTGDWTLTLHDGLNNVLATSTVTNANIRSNLVEFVFPSQVRALVKPNARTYHFHLTSTSTGKVVTSTLNDLNSADFELYAYRLVDTVNGFHPMAQFLQYILIGNGNYLAVWEPLTDKNPPNNEFLRHRLVFPVGFEVCGIAVTDEFAVIACEKRSTDSRKDFQEGKLFIWDGLSQTYNQIIDVAGGSPEAIKTFDNYPHFIVNGYLYAWLGGKDILKIRKIADTKSSYTGVVDTTHVYPNMLTVKDNLLHIGFPSTTTSESIEYGVYTWGSLDKDYPPSFNYGYVVSTLTNHNENGFTIGSVMNFGDEMYISWKDNGSYGLDIVDANCSPAPVFSYRSLKFTGGLTRKNKRSLRYAVDTEILPEGTTITPMYELDNVEQLQDEFSMSEGEVSTIATIGAGKFKRMRFGFDGVSEGTKPAEIISVSMMYDPLFGEKVL